MSGSFDLSPVAIVPSAPGQYFPGNRGSGFLARDIRPQDDRAAVAPFGRGGIDGCPGFHRDGCGVAHPAGTLPATADEHFSPSGCAGRRNGGIGSELQIIAFQENPPALADETRGAQDSIMSHHAAVELVGRVGR
ncbi:MAG: hypothetical protein MRJ96_07905 [Nitrospirales bacterium]|nr:hypothetical protein [Nitrospirales bacterium]